MAPKQVANSTLRITKPPLLFQLLFYLSGGQMRPASTLDTECRSESYCTFVLPVCASLNFTTSAILESKCN
jgi:hypothetical protein